jgi:hypothetical protein
MPGGHELKALYSTESYRSAVDERKFGLSERRGRVAAWEKRVRCRIAIPDVTDGQHARCNSALGPPAQRGPERRSMCRATEALRGPATARPERTLAP